MESQLLSSSPIWTLMPPDSCSSITPWTIVVHPGNTVQKGPRKKTEQALWVAGAGNSRISGTWAMAYKVASLVPCGRSRIGSSNVLRPPCPDHQQATSLWYLNITTTHLSSTPSFLHFPRAGSNGLPYFICRSDFIFWVFSTTDFLELVWWDWGLNLALCSQNRCSITWAIPPVLLVSFS
jgi:hypothetical protein